LRRLVLGSLFLIGLLRGLSVDLGLLGGGLVVLFFGGQ
jgi:hypothetical protein